MTLPKVKDIKVNDIIAVESLQTKKMIEEGIKKYMSDIVYEDEEGWISIITEKYDCNITRTSENKFKIDFCVETGELNIVIDTSFELL